MFKVLKPFTALVLLSYGLSAGAFAMQSFRCPGIAAPIELKADLHPWSVSDDMERDYHPEAAYCSITRMLAIDFLKGAITGTPLSQWTERHSQNAFIDRSRHNGVSCTDEAPDESFLTLKQLDLQSGLWCLTVLDPHSQPDFPIYMAGPECMGFSTRLSLDAQGEPIWNSMTLHLTARVDGKIVFNQDCERL